MSRFPVFLLPVIVLFLPTAVSAGCRDDSEESLEFVVSIDGSSAAEATREGGLVIRTRVPRGKDASPPVFRMDALKLKLHQGDRKGGRASGPYEILIYRAPSGVDYSIAAYTPPAGVRYEIRYWPPGSNDKRLPEVEIIPFLPKGSVWVKPLKDCPFLRSLP